MEKIKRHKKYRFGKHFKHKIIYIDNGTRGMIVIEGIRKKIITDIAIKIIMKRYNLLNAPIICSVEAE